MKEKRYSSDVSFARVPNHKDNPDYRIIAIYSFYQYYLSHQSIDETSNKLDQMVSAFRNRTSFNLEDDSRHYLEMYPKEMSGSIGYFIVDKTDGINTLVVYPYPTSEFNGKPNKPRMLALIKAIEDIAGTKGQILDLFEEELEWHDLEPKLKAILHYPSIKKSG
jgi:hypothetical protein